MKWLLLFCILEPCRMFFLLYAFLVAVLHVTSLRKSSYSGFVVLILNPVVRCFLLIIFSSVPQLKV